MGYIPNEHGPIALSAGGVNVIASDASNVHVIKTITVINTGASARDVHIAIGTYFPATEIIQIAAMPAHSTRVYTGFWSIPVSTVLQCVQDTGTDVTVTASGYHYT